MKVQKLFIGFIAALLLLTLTACNGAGRPGGPPGTAEEDAVTEVEESEEESEEEVDVQAEPIEQPSVTILADGQVQLGRPVLPLAFEASGKLIALNVAIGDTIAEGDVIATLDDETLQETVTSAELRVEQSTNSLVQAEADLERLLTWEPDEITLTIAEANITSAEASLSSAQNQAAAAGNSLTSAQVNIDQALREIANAQESYDNAFSPGREWEVQYDQPVCEVIGGLEQCQPITYAQRIENDRDFATTRLQSAQEQLRIARANYALEASRISDSSAVSAESSLVSAQQELERALKPPTDAEIAAAQLSVTQAELVLEQDQFSLDQAQDAVSQAQLVAPWSGTILSVDVAEGAMIGAGTPIVTLVDTNQLEFHTTNLSERDLEQIEIGQEAIITLKTYPNEPFTGTIARIDLQANGTVGDAAVFPVIIDIDPGDRVVRVGMTGRAEIVRE